MSDLQSASWRTRRRDTLFDGQLKMIALAAAGLLGVAALGYGGYSLLQSRPRVVPLVEADPRPLRVRPDNPGGMQVVGADELAGAANGQEAMAPPPEVPAPQALRAKIKAESQPPPAQPASPPAEPPPQLAATPERPAPRPSAPAKPAGAQVQLAALETEQAAMTEWQRLSHRMPDLLSHHQPAVQRAESAGRVVYRLRTGGFTDVAAATAFCAQIRSKGAGCSLASF